MSIKHKIRTITISKTVQERQYEPFTVTMTDTYDIIEDDQDTYDALKEAYYALEEEVDNRIQERFED